MNQETYNKLAEKTISSNFYVNDEKQINMLHAAMGMVTESAELIENYDGSKECDSVNVFEECGDIFWYFSIIQRELGFNIEDDYFTSTESDESYFREFGVIYCVDLIKAVANVLDLHKKMAYYGKPMDEAKYKEAFYKAAKALKVIVNLEGFNVFEIYERNIAKLKARYGEKFSEESALNRDIEKERKILAS